MCATYPTHTYLNQINRQIFPVCLHCTEKVRETSIQFTAVCPQIRGARTASHNQLRENVSDCLQKQLAEVGGWLLFEEIRMAQMGLNLRPVTADAVSMGGLQMQLKADVMCDVAAFSPI